MEEKPKVRWAYAEDIEVIGNNERTPVLLELDQSGQKVKRVNILTSEGEITYKPKKPLTKVSEVSGFTTKLEETELYTKAEFITNNPMLVLLNTKAKEENQKIVISFCILTNDKGEEFRYFNESQWNTIYFEPFHKKDKSNIDKQLEVKKKYTELSE